MAPQALLPLESTPTCPSAHAVPLNAAWRSLTPAPARHGRGRGRWPRLRGCPAGKTETRSRRRRRGAEDAHQPPAPCVEPQRASRGLAGLKGAVGCHVRPRDTPCAGRVALLLPRHLCVPGAVAAARGQRPASRQGHTLRYNLQRAPVSSGPGVLGPPAYCGAFLVNARRNGVCESLLSPVNNRLKGALTLVR